MNYQCSRCGIFWEGPIQECPKCEQTDKVSVQTEEKAKDACKSGTWEHDEGFKAEEKPATVPQSFNEWFNTKVPQEMRDAYLRSRMQMAWDAARAGTVQASTKE